MDIIDFRNCSPSIIATMWTDYEKRIRKDDSRLWMPADMERRLSWTFKDARGEPDAYGIVAMENAIPYGFAMAFRTFIHSLDIMNTIYPSQYAMINVLALNNQNQDEAAKLLLNDILNGDFFSDIIHFYSIVNYSAKDSLEGYLQAGFEEWIVLGQRPLGDEFPVENSVITRKAKISDIQSIIQLLSDMIRYHWIIDPACKTNANLEMLYRKDLEQAFGKSCEQLFVAEIDKEIVGVMHGLTYINNEYDRIHHTYPGKYGYIATAAVQSNCQGKGIGKALFAATRQWFAESNISQLYVHYSLKNPISTVFWKQLDFIPLQVTMRYRK